MLRTLLFLAALVCPPTQALQVTPSSACAQICTGDGPDAAASSTSSSDIVCRDGDYASSVVGERFENCMNCLQNSTVVGSGTSDQAWFLYNLRFALNTCLFDTANATDPISTPCSADAECGPLGGALQDEMQDPSTMHEFSYCSASDNSFVGKSLSTCNTCLRSSTDQVYLANFLVALHAGCVQRPPWGYLIGVNSTLFTKDEVMITSVESSPPQPKKPKKPLSTGAIIGIAVVCGVAGLMIIAWTFIYTRRKLDEKRLKDLQSPLDARFGAPNISAPHSNAYASPESPPLVKQAVPMTGSPQMVNLSQHASTRAGDRNQQNAYSPPLFGASMPTHHAYLPPQYTPRSRNSTSPVYGASPPSIQERASVPYPELAMSPASTTSTFMRSPPPALSPPPVPSPYSPISPPVHRSPISPAVTLPSPTGSTPSTTSNFSLNRLLQRGSNGSSEPFLPRFSLGQRSFGRGHTGPRRDARSAFQISGPIMNNGNALGLQVPGQRANNRRSVDSTDSDPLW